ncbi:MAG: LacI family DNA-binding transcriptional regulator [Anaerolineae bacterium]
MAVEKRVTIKRVAREAGVSPQTVSRVVNNHPDVSRETRQRVQHVINRLSYEPSLIARTLIQGHSRILGVVGAGLEYFGPSRTLSGIERQADELGYTVQLHLVHQPESSEVGHLWRELTSRHVDGIIWAVPEIGNNRSWISEVAIQSSLPIVFLSMRPDPNLSVVAVDNRSGGRMATEHLLANGYRSIGLITGPAGWWEVRERRSGWEEALRAAGGVIEEQLVVEGDWMPASGEQGLRRLLEQRPDVDAVFVCNDQMALGALQAACALGRQAPEELALVGFDDIPEAAYFQPPLSTISQDMVELGRSAVRELCRVIEESEQNKTLVQSKAILFQPQLIVRKSSVAHHN